MQGFAQGWPAPSPSSLVPLSHAASLRCSPPCCPGKGEIWGEDMDVALPNSQQMPVDTEVLSWPCQALGEPGRQRSSASVSRKGVFEGAFSKQGRESGSACSSCSCRPRGATYTKMTSKGRGYQSLMLSLHWGGGLWTLHGAQTCPPPRERAAEVPGCCPRRDLASLKGLQYHHGWCWVHPVGWALSGCFPRPSEALGTEKLRAPTPTTPGNSKDTFILPATLYLLVVLKLNSFFLDILS